MKYLDDQILSEAYSNVLLNEISLEDNRDKPLPEKEDNDPLLHIEGYGQLRMSQIIQKLPMYVDNIGKIVIEQNPEDPEESFFGLYNQTSLLQAHVQAIFRERKRQLDKKRGNV